VLRYGVGLRKKFFFLFLERLLKKKQSGLVKTACVLAFTVKGVNVVNFCAKRVKQKPERDCPSL
jgi:hypothetical protein